MATPYFKMEGAGNRILIVDARTGSPSLPGPEKVRWLGDTATGPGFDQLMWLLPGDGDVPAAYRVFNNDGSEVGQCGNGVRCVAWLLARDIGKKAFELASPVGRIACRIGDDDRVSVSMGVPQFEPEHIPFVADKAANSYEIDVNGAKLSIGAVSMGNPHCVLEVPDVDVADVAGLGPLLENHPRFPERANVGFMHIRGHEDLDLRVFERAVGETLACGTGACAAMAVARRRGLVGDTVRVNLPGGQLVVSWRRPADSAWLTGDAELKSEGTIDL